MSSEIFIIHPEDSDLRFFRHLISGLTRRYGNKVKYLRLRTTRESHDQCIETISRANNAFVIILCHGLENSIRGCNRESDYRRGNYNHGTFISPSNNVEAFEGHKTFCLACKSKTLGLNFVKFGAIAYIGFDDVVFSLTGVQMKRVEDIVKCELRTLLEQTLIEAIDNNHSFNKMSGYFRLLLAKKVNNFLLDKKPKGRKARHEAAKTMNRLRHGVTLFGEGSQAI